MNIGKCKFRLEGKTFDFRGGAMSQSHVHKHVHDNPTKKEMLF